jgi:Zn-dependent M28 family amino/carboxypeptidase
MSMQQPSLRSFYLRPVRHAFSALAGGVLLSSLVACAPEVPDNAEAPDADVELEEIAEEAAQVIDADLLRSHVAALSADEFEGRGPGSPGDDKAQAYLIEQMKALGLEPGGPDGQWRQAFEMRGITAQAPETWTFRKNGETVAFDWWDGYIAASGVQQPVASIEDAEVVFVGYGIQAPEYDWDDFKGVDLTGKVLLMMNNDPSEAPGLFEGERRLYYGRWTYKYESAAAQGAAGAIIIHTTPSAGYPFQVVQSSWSGEQFQLPAAGEDRLQVQAWLSEDASRELVAFAGMDLDELMERAQSRDFEPVPLEEVTTSMTLNNTVRSVETANVLGLLPGRENSGEVVLYTAHHDHLGVGQPNEAGDAIYNGALDNASGTAQVLAIARAFTALPAPPRRSVLFNFVGAEEQGLLGSAYYAAHPTFPPGKIAAVVNIDGGNIWGPTQDITFVGYEKSNLGPLVEEWAARQGRVVEPDQFPDRGFYYRSDQFSLAKIGVPGVYLDTGLRFRERPEGWGKEQIEAWEAEHYHQPSDELTDAWTFQGMIEDARLSFYVGLDVSESDDMPAWVPGDEFEAPRQQALAEVNAE